MIKAKKLQAGDTVRVVSPARSLEIISEETQKIANERFSQLGLNITFSKNAGEIDEFNSSSIKSRIDDIHEAFSDPAVKLIITTIGGFNSNQLLKHIDFDLIRNNPKLFCGYSDITALSNAIYAKTGLITYYGPHYSSFGEKLGFDYTLEYFQKCLFLEESFEIKAPEKWSNDQWYINQEQREFIDNDGLKVINEGEAEGVIIGGNLCTLNLLQGTEFFPDLDNSVLFIEDDELSFAEIFDRDLQSLLHQAGSEKIKGIVIGRFEKKSRISPEKLEKIVKSKKELLNIPIISQADFGHTDPKITFPIGGKGRISSSGNQAEIKILDH